MEMQITWLIASVLTVWLSSCFSLSLKAHLWFVLFYPQALSDGQYVLVFAAAIAAGVFVGLVPVVLTVILAKWKPQFAQTALWVALGYTAFWAVVTTACEAIFIGWECGGYGVLMTSLFMPAFLVVSLLFVPDFKSFLPYVFALLPLMVALLVAFYFTSPRGWKTGSRSWDTF
jgi:hypothetical protein